MTRERIELPVTPYTEHAVTRAALEGLIAGLRDIGASNDEIRDILKRKRGSVEAWVRGFSLKG